MTEQPPLTPEPILQLGLGFWASKTLLSAVELGLFTVLAETGPLDAETLRGRLELHERSAEDFFDALVALGMLEREDGRYSNTPSTDLFLDRAKPTYVGRHARDGEGSPLPVLGHPDRGPPDRRAAERGQAAAATSSRQIYADPARLGQFAAAMSSISVPAGQAIAAKFPWKDHRSVIDFGCAEGRGPGPGRAGARARDAAAASTCRCSSRSSIATSPSSASATGSTFTGGDFFADRLPQADVFVMGHILHDWDLDEKRKLLKSAYDALPDGGALIVYDAIIDDDRRENAFGLLMSLNMLIETPGGFDYTGADCCGWMREAGFRDTYVEHLLGPDSMVVGFK